MGRILLFCLIFILGVVYPAMADEPRTSGSPVGQKPETESRNPAVAEAPGNLPPVELNRESQKVSEGESEKKSEEEAYEIAEAPENRKMGKHKRSSDESVAGGGVIIGGLATAILAAVFCYIRVTRKKHSENPV